MGRLCAVYGCNVTSANKEGTSTHIFPKEPGHIRRAWINFVKATRKDFVQPKSSHVVCGGHFTHDSFQDQFTASFFQTELGYRPKRKLKLDAVPTIMPEDCTAAFKKVDAAKRTLESADAADNNRRKRRRKREVLKSLEERRSHQKASRGCDDAGTSHALDADKTADADSDAEWLDDDSTEVTPLQQEQASTSRPVTMLVHAGVQHNTIQVQHRKVMVRMRPHRRSKGIYVKPVTQSVGVQCDFKCQCDSKCPTCPAPLQCSSPIPDATDLDGTIEYACCDSNSPADNIHDVDSGSDFDPLSDTDSDADIHSISMESATSEITSPPPCLPHEERKYIVFRSSLLQLFKQCPSCMGPGRTELTELGTLVTMNFTCTDCVESWQWNSQPLIGKMPAANILLSAAILFSGSLLSKSFQLLDAMNLSRFSEATFYKHQSYYLQPTVTAVWSSVQAELLDRLANMGGNLILAGDGRSDSPGHCAKYGGFNTLECRINKVIDIQVVQSNEVGNSARCENEGLKRMLHFVEEAGHEVEILITDRHKQNEKFLREEKPVIKHYFDVWHVAKGLTKKLTQIANKSGMEMVGDWRKSIINHLHWVAASTPDGDGEVMVAKWDSLLNHLVNVHEGHGELFPACLHEPLHDESRQKAWFTPASEEYSALRRVLENKFLMKDLKKLSPFHQTSCLEAFHSLIIRFCPKHTSFSYLGMYCRLFLAAMHYNENADRQVILDDEGNPKVSVTFPKAKKGEYSIRKIKGEPTYYLIPRAAFAGCVSRLLHYLFEKLAENPAALRESLPNKFRERPDSLAAAYHHPSKEEAAATYVSRYRDDVSYCNA